MGTGANAVQAAQEAAFVALLQSLEGTLAFTLTASLQPPDFDNMHSFPLVQSFFAFPSTVSLLLHQNG